MPKSNKIFFVEGLGLDNESIADRSMLSKFTITPNEAVECIDGKERPLWECQYELIRLILKSRAPSQPYPTIWYKESPSGKAKKWPFTKKQKITRKVAEKKKLLFQMPPEKLTPVS